MRNLLLPDEEIKGIFAPVRLSFIRLFLPYIYLIGIGVVFLVFPDQISSIANNLWILGHLLQGYMNSILFGLFLLIPAVIVGLLRISVKTPLFFALVFFMGLYMDASGWPYSLKFWLCIGVGILFFVLVDFYRRGHKYYVTNYRLIVERTFVRYDRRELMLEKIEDVAVEQGILGRIFKFGNIIPASASGVGTGMEHSGLYLGFGAKLPKTPIDMGMIVGGGRGITGFRARSNNCFFGVSNPVELNNLISEWKYGRSEATKLEDIKRLLGQTKDKDLK